MSKSVKSAREHIMVFEAVEFIPYILAICYSVPAYFPISEELREKLNRLVQLSVRMGRLRERSSIINTNVSHFENQQGMVRIHPNEYFMYMEEKAKADELKEAMMLVQEEMDELQSQIMVMIYGPSAGAGGMGGNTQ